MIPVVLENLHYAWEEDQQVVFEGLTLELPPGITSFIGQNGTGKSTLLLLAGGVLLPQKGRVLINDIDSTELRDESARHREVSFIYQNMEFETEESVADLLRLVYESGFHEDRDPAFVEELMDVFELEGCLDRRTGEVSKGELQRVILAFSLLYGSRILMMDEPVFAMEDRQKHRAFEFLSEYARARSVSMFYSAHELELSEQYSQHIVLFRKDGPPELGPTSQMYVRERIEEAYQVPFTLLKQRERLFRKLLIQRDRAEN